MKNKFFVCIELFFGIVFLFGISIGAYVWFACDAFGENLFITVFLSIMLLVLPLIMLIILFFWLCPIIEVTDVGISKKIFGICIKSFKWEDISEVKYIGNIVARTISFYVEHNKDTVLRKSKRAERIVFYISEKKLNIVKHYAPEYIIEKLNTYN